jgi:hypothetical protein
MVMRGENRRLIITIPPRHLKSICTSVALPAFILGHDPTRRIICVSYSQVPASVHEHTAAHVCLWSVRVRAQSRRDCAHPHRPHHRSSAMQARVTIVSYREL